MFQCSTLIPKHQCAPSKKLDGIHSITSFLPKRLVFSESIQYHTEYLTQMLEEIKHAFLNNNINQEYSRGTSGNSNISSEIKLKQQVWGYMASSFTLL